MKKFYKGIRQRIDWILIIIGSFMTSYSFFNFEITGPSASRIFDGTEGTIHAYGYFYSPETTFTIALGISLLILGILIYKERAGRR